MLTAEPPPYPIRASTLLAEPSLSHSQRKYFINDPNVDW